MQTPVHADRTTILVEAIDTGTTSSVPPIDLDRWTDLARAVLAGLDLGRPVEMGLRFVDESAIGELNERYMAQPGPTDVLSFPVDGDPRRNPAEAARIGRDEPTALGDVIICQAVAVSGAEQRGVGLDDELALLIVHGILHLLGWDHVTPSEAEAMQAEERRLLHDHHVGAS